MAQTVALTPGQEKQLARISDRLVAEKVDASIARAYARSDTQGQEYAANIKAMDEAMAVCQRQYAWSDKQTNLAAEIAMFQIVLDNFTRTLGNTTGVTQAAFEQIGAVLTATSREDQRTLMDGAWRDDDALLKLISDRLIAAGLPSDTNVLAYAFLIMEAKLVVTYRTMDWVELIL